MLFRAALSPHPMVYADWVTLFLVSLGPLFRRSLPVFSKIQEEP